MDGDKTWLKTLKGESEMAKFINVDDHSSSFPNWAMDGDKTWLKTLKGESLISSQHNSTN